MRDHLLRFVCLFHLLYRGLQGLLALGTIDLYRVLDVSLALSLVYDARLVLDVRNYREILLIRKEWFGHLYSMVFIIRPANIIGEHWGDFIKKGDGGIYGHCTVLNAAFR